MHGKVGGHVHAGEMATEADGMHPTEMHSCYGWLCMGSFLLSYPESEDS